MRTPASVRTRLEVSGLDRERRLRGGGSCAWPLVVSVGSSAGFRVVATSSVAVARSLGHADGERAPVDEMLAAARRIACAVDVPVMIDAESGYGLPPAELVERLIEVGASGFNIEDTDHRTGARRQPEQQAELLAALGVARVSLGGGLRTMVRAANGRILADLAERGSVRHPA